jgi:tetratricopeptide (TPR) repeat protein
MGKSSRRKRQRRAQPMAAAQRRPHGDRAVDSIGIPRPVRVDRAMGTLIGDYGMQINYFSRVTAEGDALELQPVEAALPAESSVFASREADLAELLELFDPEVSGAVPRVAVITGMAGIGKSELVLHVAHEAVRNGWFPGGVLFVTLHGDDLEVAQIALDGFLSATGIPGDRAPADLQARSRLFSSVIEQYAQVGRPVLVVIDNAVSAEQCELLVPAGGRALVTSRNELSILDARLVRLGILSDEAGADLLAGQLGVSVGADTRVADHRDDARAIAGLCGGLPLAIRIVAAILAENRARSLARVVVDLRDARTRLDQLTWEGQGEALAVRAAFDVSYSGIQSERRRVFRLLAINPGPEISTAAASVLTGLDERAVRSHLEGLARTHLIERGSADGRWRMHDLIRIYAAEEEPKGTADAWAKLIVYYMNTATAATQHLAPATYHPAKRTFSERAEALAWLDIEYPNLAAIALLPIPNPMFADVALGLWRYFELRRRINDGIMLTRHALLIAGKLRDRRRKARAHTNLTALFRQARMFNDALAAGRAAVRAYRSVGDREGLGIALNNLAGAQLAAERFEEAIATGLDAVEIFRSLGDRHREAIALAHIATAREQTGQISEGIAAYTDVLSAMRDAGDQRGEAAALLNIGWSLKEANRLDEAITAEKQAVAIFRELGDRVGEGSALNNLGSFLYLEDRGGEAIPVLNEAVGALTDVDDIHSRGGALVNLGMAFEESGHFDEAVKAFTEAATDYRETRDRTGEGAAERGRGQALLGAGRREQSAEAFRVAIEIFREVGDRLQEGIALALAGSVLPEAQREEAIAAFEGAVAAFQETGEPALERAATGGLLSLKFPVPSLAEWCTRADAGTSIQITPHIWLDVHTLGDQEDEEGQRIAEEIRARIRKATTDAVDKNPRGKQKSPDLPET